MIQWSHPYMTTGKIITLTIQTFVSKVMSLLFNMLSKSVIVFLPRIKCFLFCLFCFAFNFLVAVTVHSDLELPKIKSVTVSTFPFLFATKWWDQMPWSWFCECWVLRQLTSYQVSHYGFQREWLHKPPHPNPFFPQLTCYLSKNRQFQQRCHSSF